ncbi:MAG: Gldg family protein [Candidatus Pseudobacter hemicellulosilyticus]|uniref:Gldg family protein n=1 Tax=Candidatus Pseudobacter hemicellulosilyticus TaxID=3121375 RepID=A0AAJ5WXP8_9BACT|nr:MAG: Gldg family protein [Pseudobacter sp.]
MRKTFYIARNELYALFYSPIAWILMLVFLVMSSAEFFGLYGYLVAAHERGGLELLNFQNLTRTMLQWPMLQVIRSLYIFFPLITMGLMSRETSSGTIKLLYSSPLHIRELIFGKYLAILTFALCLIALLALTLLVLLSAIPHADYGLLTGSLSGMFLVLATYSAIGLFISSLTSYQIVAAIITLGVFALLGSIGGIWQEYDVIRYITAYINIGGKSHNALRGLLNLRDITYFLIVIAIFLSFSILRIKSATESIPAIRKGMRYLLVLALAAMLGYITSQPEVNVYADTTQNDINTITPPTQRMLAKLNEGPLEVTVYANLFTGFMRFSPAAQLAVITQNWEPYIRFKPDIKVNFAYYYALDTAAYQYKVNPGKSLQEIAAREAKTYGMGLDAFLDSATVSKQVDIREEEFRCFFVLKYKEKTSILRTFDDMEFWPQEDETAAALSRLIDTPPRILFLSDELERSPFGFRPRDYRGLTSLRGNRYALINQGYDFDTLSLKRSPAVPKDISALVIADPRTAIPAESLQKIGEYIDRGGNVLITAEPDRKAVVTPLLARLGLSMRDGMLVQPGDKTANNIIFAYMSDTAQRLSPQLYKQLDNDHKYMGDSIFAVSCQGAGVLEYQARDGFRVDPLLRTRRQDGWNRLDPVSDDELLLRLEKRPNDETGDFLTAVRLTRQQGGRQQRIFVMSDADCLLTLFIPGPRSYNYVFGFWCFSQFAYGQFPANTMRPDSPDRTFTIVVDDIDNRKTLLYWIIPGVIALFSALLLIRRKRK